MKLVRERSRPISGDSGLNDIKRLAEQGDFPVSKRKGTVSSNTDKSAYIKHLLGYIELQKLKPLKIVAECRKRKC